MSPKTLVIASTCLGLVGNALIKSWHVDGANTTASTAGVLLGLGLLCWSIQTLLWFWLLGVECLGRSAGISSALWLIGSAIMGALLFGERLGARDVAGIGCCLMGLWLLLTH